MNCVRHEEKYDQEVPATWPRGQAKFCSEGCAAFYGLEAATQTVPAVPVAKEVAPGQPHAKGASTHLPPGDPRQGINRNADAATAVAPPPADGDVLPYDEWSKTDLKTECEARGLPVGGTKDDLIARLADHDEATE